MRCYVKKLDIIYEDKNLLVICKPAKLLTIGTDKVREHTLFHMASDYVKKQYPKNKVFIVNRLDKDTSGLVVFAKNEEFKRNLQNHWNEWVKRWYIAIVEGCVAKDNGVIRNYLWEDNTLKVHEIDDSKKGDLSITHYRVIKRTKAYTMVKIQIETGRKNQIRVHMNGMGHPIIGDKKYGARKNPLGRLGLHANCLEMHIPHYKDLVIECPLPKEFQNIKF